MRRWFWLLLPLPILVAGVLAWELLREQPANAAATAAPAQAPVVAGVATARDVPIYLAGIGTVQAFNTVTVKARVDGQIDKIAFTEART